MWKALARPTQIEYVAAMGGEVSREVTEQELVNGYRCGSQKGSRVVRTRGLGRFCQGRAWVGTS